MKAFQLFVLLFGFVVIFVFAQENITVTPLFRVSDIYGTSYSHVWPASSGGEYILFSDGDASFHTRILQRNSTGLYHLVHDEIGFSHSVSTNGRWFAILPFLVEPQHYTLFQLHANGSVINRSTLATTTNARGKLLEDDIFVTISNETITSYQYNDERWTAIQSSSSLNIEWSQDIKFHLHGNHLAGYDTSLRTIKLFTRQVDNAWTLTDSFVYNATNTGQMYTIVWNGDDTVIIAEAGRVYIYQKESNQWIVKRSTTAADIGITTSGGLGHAMEVIDQNTIIITIPTIHFNVYRGYAVILQRQNGIWSYVRLLTSNGTESIGFAVAKNDVDVVFFTAGNFPNLLFSFFSYPLNIAVSPSNQTPDEGTSSPFVNIPSNVNTPRGPPITSSAEIYSSIILIPIALILFLTN